MSNTEVELDLVTDVGCIKPWVKAQFAVTTEAFLKHHLRDSCDMYHLDDSLCGKVAKKYAKLLAEELIQFGKGD